MLGLGMPSEVCSHHVLGQPRLGTEDSTAKPLALSRKLYYILNTKICAQSSQLAGRGVNNVIPFSSVQKIGHNSRKRPVL